MSETKTNNRNNQYHYPLRVDYKENDQETIRNFNRVKMFLGTKKNSVAIREAINSYVSIRERNKQMEANQRIVEQKFVELYKLLEHYRSLFSEDSIENLERTMKEARAKVDELSHKAQALKEQSLKERTVPDPKKDHEP